MGFKRNRCNLTSRNLNNLPSAPLISFKSPCVTEGLNVFMFSEPFSSSTVFLPILLFWFLLCCRALFVMYNWHCIFCYFESLSRLRYLNPTFWFVFVVYVIFFMLVELCFKIPFCSANSFCHIFHAYHSIIAVTDWKLRQSSFISAGDVLRIR